MHIRKDVLSILSYMRRCRSDPTRGGRLLNNSLLKKGNSHLLVSVCILEGLLYCLVLQPFPSQLKEPLLQ